MVLLLFKEELISFGSFFKKSELHFSCRKAISWRSRRLKSQNLLTISNLVNLCLVKKISLVLTPVITISIGRILENLMKHYVAKTSFIVC